MGGAGRAKEVPTLALYLVGSESDYVTGQSFVIDGGV
ncbi:SDR family oxidoreductase [Pseudomonas syringae]|nr:SDR family oxidoreductase [Pseudomonas syringae]